MYGGRVELYLPHFHRGVALYALGQCKKALEEWVTSERNGAIKLRRARSEYKILEELRAECREGR